MSKKIIVIGGGAAGLMAAGQASKRGADVTILEKKNKCARKLRITGKGRCNLSNDSPLPDFIVQFGKNGKFLHQAFSKFFNKELIAFFENIGVPTETQRGSRIFPKSELAEDVVDALLRWIKDQQVNIIYDSSVTNILTDNNTIVGVETASRQYHCDAVIIATGGASYPATGSTGDGYKLLGKLGHKIIPVRPALVPLETTGNTALKLQGLSLKNITAKLYIDGKNKKELFGEMLFTHFGLSGPIILTLSGMAVDALEQNKNVVISIDLKPALTEEQLNQRLLRDFKEFNKQQYKSVLKKILPNKLIQICIEQTQIVPDKQVNQISAQERNKLCQWLKDFHFNVNGHRSFSEAIITAGGVSLKEINPRTMESKLVKNLYIAGELLDIDGNTGGFNLQAAFSTGYLAGISAVSD